jgi:hypothetical protein
MERDGWVSWSQLPDTGLSSETDETNKSKMLWEIMLCTAVQLN